MTVCYPRRAALRLTLLPFPSPHRAEDDKCMSVQCIYCQQVRAKNTTRQKQHLLQCAPYLQAHPDVALQASAASAASAASVASAAASAAATTPAAAAAAPAASAAPAAPTAPTAPGGDAPAEPSFGQDEVAGEHTTLSFMPNTRINGSPAQGRPSLPAEGAPAPKRQKTKQTPSSNLPEIPLREVHAAFVEFRAKEDDKCMSARCIYCNQVRAKNTSRQREHLMVCPNYQAVLKEKIPANNLRYQFDEDDVASSLSLPKPGLELDLRMSIRVKPKLNVGGGASGRQSWVSCVGGQWAGRWGKGVFRVSSDPAPGISCHFAAPLYLSQANPLFFPPSCSLRDRTSRRQ